MTAITEILCRFDAAKQAGVVFLRDTITPDNKIQVWDGAGKPTFMPLDYYKMTSHLSAADERVLMERFKEATGRKDQLVHINHRMPRNSRPVPNLLSPENAALSVLTPAQEPAEQSPVEQKAPAVQRKSSAKPLDAQPLPQGPTGDLPQAGEVPGAPVLLDRRAADRANDTPSAAMWRNIEALQARMVELNNASVSLTQQLHATNIDLDATKQACQELIAEYQTAIEAEAQERLRKQKEALASVMDVMTPDASAAQEPASVAPVQQPATPPAPAPAKAQAAARKAPAKSAPASTGSKKK